MIQNERQYKVTKAKLKDLEQELLALLQNRELPMNTHPRLMKMQSAALEDQIQVMYGEIAEYENLKDGKVRITIDRLSELPIALIKARISACLGRNNSNRIVRLSFDKSRLSRE